MGKRKKSSRGPAKRVTQKLDTKFNCLFCNHDQSVSCTLDKRNSIGTLSCKICGQSFQTRINSLSQPVDVYSDWFDAVEEVNAEREDANSDSEGSSSDYESDSDDDQNTSTRVKSGSARVVVDSDEEDEEEADERHRVGARNVVDSDEDDE